MLLTIKALSYMYEEELYTTGHEPHKLRQEYNESVLKTGMLEEWTPRRVQMMKGPVKEIIYGDVKAFAGTDCVVKFKYYYTGCSCDDDCIFCDCPNDQVHHLLAFKLDEIGTKLQYIHIMVIEYDLRHQWRDEYPPLSDLELVDDQLSWNQILEKCPRLIEWLASKFGYEPLIAAYA